MKITIEITAAEFAAVTEALTAHRALLCEQSHQDISDKRYDAIREVRLANQRFQQALIYTYENAERLREIEDAQIANAAAGIVDLVVEKQPFQTTVELQVFFNGRQHSWELPADQEAFGAAQLLAGFGDRIEQVTAIKWHHSHNLPGALPAIRSNSCALNVWVLAGGQPTVRGVNIHG